MPVNKGIQLKHFLFLCVILVFVFNACRNDQPKLTLPKIKSETPKAEIKIHRYDQALFALSRTDLNAGLSGLQKEYSFFLGSNLGDPLALAQMQNYLGDPVIQALNRDVQKQFGNIGYLEGSFSEAFTNYKSYFPAEKMPKVYTYISGVDPESPIRLVDSVMIIGIDNFLGAESKFYKELGIPVYKSTRFAKDYLVPAAVILMADKFLPEPNRNMSLLDWMIREGKRLYFLDCMLPEIPDEVKIGYTLPKEEWCVKNTGNLWGYLLSNSLLFKNDSKNIIAFIGDAPFTKGFSEESPGRTGVWLGWQIVRAYMSNTNKVSLPQLMQETDSQKILSVSRYKPEKNK